MLVLICEDLIVGNQTDKVAEKVTSEFTHSVLVLRLS